MAFAPRGTGTTVTATQRGLDRLAPEHAAELRRSRWALVGPYYSDHVAGDGRSFALALGILAFLEAMFAAIAFLVSGREGGQRPSGVLVTAELVALATATAIAIVAVRRLERRLVRRGLLSRRRYRRNLLLAIAVILLLNLLGFTVYSIADGRPPSVYGFLPTIYGAVIWWAILQQGPAAGRSRQERAPSPKGTFTRLHWLLIAFAVVGLLIIASTIGLGDLVRALFTVVMVVCIVFWLGTGISVRRERRRLGFDPDFYLAVARSVSEADRRPELLIHRASEDPEFSGWHAYSGEPNETAPDTWSLRDLVDRSPEAVHPLREGCGRWRWDHAQHVYRRVEEPVLA